jgi:hypothetical protein
MDEWISIEDELIVTTAAALPRVMGDLQHDESRKLLITVYDKLMEYITANGLDSTKNVHG